MSRQRVQYVLVCEDQQQEAFARAHQDREVANEQALQIGNKQMYVLDQRMDVEQKEIDNEKALELVEAEGLTYIHPFDDPELIAGQGTLGLEIMDQFPETELLIVPIGGGGLISGVSMAAKSVNPSVRIIGVESSGAPGMKRSVEAGASVVLDDVDCLVDGLRVRKVGNHTCSVVSRFVDEIVTLPDAQIFDAMLWLMTRAKVVVEGAAAAPVGALLQGLVDAPAGTRTVCVLSGGNLDVEGMRGRSWN